MPPDHYPTPAAWRHGPDVLSWGSGRPRALTRTPAPHKRRLAAALALVLLLAVALAPPASASLRTQLARALAVQGVSKDATAAFAYDLASSRVVFRRNADLSLRPASNEKLPVAVTALDRLGGDFRIPTEVLGEGALVDGVWKGNVVLKGYGDPTLTSAKLTALAKRLQALGIRRISGHVVGDESYYDTRRTAPGWKPSYYKEESPPLSGLVVDRAKVGGWTVDNPALAAAQALRTKLSQLGIRVRLRATTGVAAADAVLLARTRSATLAVLVGRMNRVSDNFVAEMLLKHLGAVLRGSGSTAAGAQVVKNELRQRGVTMSGVRIVDGSGLSELDRMTARALGELLISAGSDAAIAADFRASLPVAGVNGTLRDRMKSPPARGNVFAKTGTTARSSTLSGYVRARFVFSILMNGNPVPWWYARRGQDRFAQILAGR